MVTLLEMIRRLSGSAERECRERQKLIHALSNHRSRNDPSLIRGVVLRLPPDVSLIHTFWDMLDRPHLLRA